MEIPILDYFDDEGIINKDTYLKQQKDDFFKLSKLKELNIDTALFIFSKTEIAEFESKVELFYVFSNGSNKNNVYLFDNKFLLAYCPPGGPSSAGGLMEELGFMGITNFFICGSAGQIDLSYDGSTLLLVEKAIRDEGTSYHYLKPSLYVETDKDLTQSLANYLEKNKFEYKKIITWTCDAFYRETPKAIEKRISQGAVSVEMECASLASVAKYRGYKFAQLLYFSDLLKQNAWQWKADKKELKLMVIKLMIDFICYQVQNNN